MEWRERERVERGGERRGRGEREERERERREREKERYEGDTDGVGLHPQELTAPRLKVTVCARVGQ